jgi:hypothetical protein
LVLQIAGRERHDLDRDRGEALRGHPGVGASPRLLDTGDLLRASHGELSSGEPVTLLLKKNSRGACQAWLPAWRSNRVSVASEPQFSSKLSNGLPKAMPPLARPITGKLYRVFPSANRPDWIPWIPWAPGQPGSFLSLGWPEASVTWFSSNR